MLIFRVYDIIMELQQHVAVVRQGGAGAPNTRAVARAIVQQEFPHLLAAAKILREDALVLEQVAKVERSFVYLEDTIITGMDINLAIYKAFRLFDPARIDTLGADIAEVETQLKLIPFFAFWWPSFRPTARLPLARAWMTPWIVRRGGLAQGGGGW